MILLRSLLFNLLFYGWTALAVVGGLPTLVLPYAAVRWLRHHWVRGALAILRATVGIGFEIRGQVPSGCVLIASKHQSAWDTLVWGLLIPNSAIVLKRELLWVPLFGWYCLKTGMIPVDRAGGSQALKKMLRSAETAARAGRPIVIFPEGTRTAPGSRRDYLPGVAALYRHLKVPAVPVAVNSGLYWPRRTFLKHPGTIVIEFLAPIDPGLDRRTFMTRLESAIESASLALLEEAPAGAPVDSSRGDAVKDGDTAKD